MWDDPLVDRARIIAPLRAYIFLALSPCCARWGLFYLLLLFFSPFCPSYDHTLRQAVGTLLRTQFSTLWAFLVHFLRFCSALWDLTFSRTRWSAKPHHLPPLVLDFNTSSSFSFPYHMFDPSLKRAVCCVSNPSILQPLPYLISSLSCVLFFGGVHWSHIYIAPFFPSLENIIAVVSCNNVWNEEHALYLYGYTYTPSFTHACHAVGVALLVCFAISQLFVFFGCVWVVSRVDWWIFDWNICKCSRAGGLQYRAWGW